VANGKPKRKGPEAGGPPSPATVESAVWALFAVAVAATAYFLLREPEDSTAASLDSAMATARLLALGAGVVGGALGVWHVLRRGGGQNLFAVAVLLNVIVGCYWILRLALAG